MAVRIALGIAPVPQVPTAEPAHVVGRCGAAPAGLSMSHQVIYFAWPTYSASL